MKVRLLNLQVYIHICFKYHIYIYIYMIYIYIYVSKYVYFEVCFEVWLFTRDRGFIFFLTSMIQVYVSKKIPKYIISISNIFVRKNKPSITK
jgi:hypothetical protein